MAGLGGGAGNLAFWLHLRRRVALTSTPEPEIAVPAGEGPLLLLHLPAGQEDPASLTPIIGALLSARKDLRVAFAGGTRQPTAKTGAETTAPARTVNLPPLDDLGRATAALSQLNPAGVLILGDDLPVPLIAAAAQIGIPLVMAEARLGTALRRGLWQDTISRAALGRIDSILAPDEQSAALARRFGVDPFRIEMTGPVTDTRAPIRGNEAERQVLAQMLRGRHIWLVASPTLAEALAALAAHHAALQYNHRAMMILAGLPKGSLPEILQSVEDLGMTAILREDDEDPKPDDQILIAEDDEEMGLWYRLAPVCFVGGTLMAGEARAPRHPFEPAALGSAIIHGPLTGAFEAEWAQLDGANAARLVGDRAALKQAVGDLSLADQAANLAQSAWNVCTGGAAVVRRIVSETLTAMEGRR
ncbi:3-deoxy-D-manno-octulosonic acid transferase [Paracoccus aminophilus]|uniref:3-deoxy-D-manno-octulosonic acid transferase n=1 Tax=Paracoccus aminophilus JCM 7686 TaxID=1367847 RepID=S5XRR6_PARAH|nr:glycosyltransferase N-terminal domain-containing protein [Paracoccus aminophilus]AGT10104.1 3-deoxy-D-manno-octulosonic-acid transferase [Paracoccus aminophilus JCM 7686]